MKTILRTNRPQNKYIGFSLLLLIAIFGLFIGGVKPPTGEVTQTPIGGNGSIVVPVPTPVLPCALTDIGGQKIPQDPNPLGYAGKCEIGGNQGQPKDPHPLALTGGAEIGGDNQQKPKDPNPLGAIFEIGGQRVPGDANPLGLASHTEIRAYNQAKLKEQATRLHGAAFEIGGNSVPRTGPVITPGAIPCSEFKNGLAIGGNQSVPQTPSLPHVSEIGGNGTVTPAPTLPDISCGQTVSGVLAEIGGTGSGSQVPRDLDPGRMADIGGQSTPRTGTGPVGMLEIGAGCKLT
jgi:hypothetical protein